MRKDRNKLLDEIGQALKENESGNKPLSMCLNTQSNVFLIEYQDKTEDVSPEKWRKAYETFEGVQISATIRESEQEKFSFLLTKSTKQSNRVNGFIYIVPGE